MYENNVMSCACVRAPRLVDVGSNSRVQRVKHFDLDPFSVPTIFVRDLIFMDVTGNSSEQYFGLTIEPVVIVILLPGGMLMTFLRPGGRRG